ncbi:MAG: AraC family transcriptional regulator ligand-binding domain-containing protein [Myxococcales bacterium]|nr:AraC family transcriptional regulator ligand-binding domain-containing protein [Myxococcales bacterium]
MFHRSDTPLETSWSPLLQNLGLDAQDVMRRAGLSQDLWTRGNTRISTRDHVKFWRALEQAVDAPALPLRLAEAIPTGSFSPPLFAALCSPNLTVAADRLASYKRLHAPVLLNLTETHEALRLSLRWSHTEGAVPESWAGAELAFLVRLARFATRECIVPTLVTAPQGLHPEAEYRDFFGVTPSLGSAYALEFHATDATRPFCATDETLWQGFEPVLRRRLGGLDHKASTRDRVRAILLEALPSGQSGMDLVARRLSTSKRTLQRKLAEEGTTYQRMLSETRAALARHYLGRTELSCTEISFLLGFEDPNSFFRAYHTWTGQTPVAHRQQLGPSG